MATRARAFFASFVFFVASFTVNAAPKTTDDRVAEFGEVVRQRLEPDFRKAGVNYPPKWIVLLGLKAERLLEVYAADEGEDFHFVRAYPVLAASGVAGPKLREGDEQVPEGVYRLRELNPNSQFHLSLWIDYPNTFDRWRAIAERRSKLGGEIMIHGQSVSRGCLAMGDPAAEDLFVLAALCGIRNVRVVLAPLDFRKTSAAILPNESSFWLGKLYRNLRRELVRYPTAVLPNE